MTYRFELSFNAPRKGDPPFPPMWHIYTTHGAVTKQGHSVTPTDCVENDIDSEIDKLINELNSLRKKVKKRYRDWNE